MTDPFVDLVRWAGFLIAAAASITFTWKRRAKWEPHISDVPDSPAKVVGLINALVLGALWFDKGTSFGLPSLQKMTVIGGGAAILGLLVYVFLSTVYVYDRERAIGTKKTENIKIVGGLWLTQAARTATRQGIDVQTALKQAGNKPDLVWPRTGRALAQSLFLVSYFLLVCGGTVAMSSVVLLNYAPR